MRVLCYVNHYFGKSPGFAGGSSGGTQHRRQIVTECLDRLRALPGAEVQVCGIDDRALVPVDIDFSSIRDSPRYLVYESLAQMAGRVDEGYDYFVNIEDDIALPGETFANCVRFDADASVTEVLLPNRMEHSDAGAAYCVDLKATPGWTFQRRRHRGHELRVALNPHSGLLILSRDKLRYALEHLDRGQRRRYVGAEMASAYAYYHSPFSLFRSYGDDAFHTVEHMDRWTGPGGHQGVAMRRDDDSDAIAAPTAPGPSGPAHSSCGESDIRTSAEARGGLAPHMSSEQVTWLRERMRSCSGYVEFGSGGSTALASENVHGSILTVDSSREWIERTMETPRVRERMAAGDLELHHADIGPTGEWGMPLGPPSVDSGLEYAVEPLLRLGPAQRSAADLVLVDGRFRVACALATVLLLPRHGVMMVDDYVDRPHYRVLEGVLGAPRMVGRAAVFQRDAPDMDRCLELLPDYFDDPR